MNKKIGIDIVEVRRFREKIYASNISFYKKIFLDEEIKYCLKFKDPFPHFAGKFAAKEAIIKTINKKIKLNQIKIKNKKNRLEVWINNEIDEKILISISHETNYAVAISEHI